MNPVFIKVLFSLALKQFIATAMMLLFAIVAYGQQFTIKDIRIEGLQRVSSSSVFAELLVRVGDTATKETLANTIRKLFKTGLFSQLQAYELDGVLILKVKELAVVSSIKLEGNKAIKSEALLKSLDENGLSEGQIFKPATLGGMKRSLIREYVAQGHYAAAVETEIKELPRNRIAITIAIEEGKKTSIKRIHIVGNQAFKTKKLLSLFESKSSTLFTWFSNKDKYAREKMAGDLKRLETFYLNKGYLKFSIDSTQVSISPDKKSIYITININEGVIYTLGEIKLLGDLVVPKEQLLPLIFLRRGETYSQARINLVKEWLSGRLSNAGYTFAEIKLLTNDHKPDTLDADSKSDSKSNVVDLTFLIKPNKQTYVHRIEFRGNTRTSDEVLRREMRQLESASASKRKIDLGKVRLNRLGFFEKVDVTTIPVAGTEDQIDVIYEVIEQNSGSVTASLGYSEISGLVLGGSLTENNFLGTGNFVSFNIHRSSYQSLVNVSYTNPYFTPEGVSSGFNIYARTTDYSKINVATFNTNSLGSRINFGFPLSEVSRLNLGLGLEQLDLETGQFAPEEIQELDAVSDKFNSMKATAFWNQVVLNKGLLPSKGYSQRLGLEISLPGSDLTYFKAFYNAQLFVPLPHDFKLRIRTKLGFGDSYGSKIKRLPFYENFYGGGFGSLRGFEPNTLGPRETPSALETLIPTYDENSVLVTDDDGIAIGFPSYSFTSIAQPIGGNVSLIGSFEFLLPIPLLKDNPSVQSSLFLDYGNIFDTKCGVTPEEVLSNGSLVPERKQELCSKPAFNELRYSIGLGVTWISGLGPLTFSIGKAFNKADPIDNGLFAVRPEETEFFQFSLGHTF